MVGYWKFHRSMLDHAVWSLPADQLKVWLTILSKANYKDGNWDDGVNQVTVPCGSFVTSQDHLAIEAKVGRQTVRTAIRNLIRLESISTNIVTNRYTIINVVKWPIYNVTESEANQQSNQPLTNRQPTANHSLRRKERKKKNIVGDVAPTLPLEKKPMTSYQAVMASYSWTFEREYKAKPPITAIEGKAAKALSDGRTPEEAAWIVYEYLTYPSRTVQDKGLYSLRNILFASATILAKENKHKLPHELLILIGGTNEKGKEHVSGNHGTPTGPSVETDCQPRIMPTPLESNGIA